MTAKQSLLELQENGYCVLGAHLPKGVIEACRDAFWPVLLTYLKNHGHEPNRGPHRHCLPMPFDKPCFAPEFFFDQKILGVVRGAMGRAIVADQWGCDVPLRGSEYQRVHVDYQCPLFEEAADLLLPPYMLVVSFGLVSIREARFREGARQDRTGRIDASRGQNRVARSLITGTHTFESKSSENFVT